MPVNNNAVNQGVPEVKDKDEIEQAIIEIIDDPEVDTNSTLLTKAVLRKAFPNDSFDIYESFPSRPADKINIPEISKLKTDFVYNYYTKDERLREVLPNGSKIISLDTSDTDELFFQIKNKKAPRYAKITFKSPKAGLQYISDIDETSVVTENFERVISEGAFSNDFFTGIEILDTGKENKIYTMMNASIFFNEIPAEKNSQKEAAQKLYETLQEKGGLEGEDKRLIVESFSNIASEGYTLAPSDVPEDIAKFSSDPIGKQTFSVQFNNLLMSNIISNSTIYSDNVFNDEIRSLQNFSKEIREKLLPRSDFQLNPPVFDPVDYELTVEAINQRAPYISPSVLNDNSATSLEKLMKDYPKIKFLGYIVEKFEVLPDESVEFVGRKFIAGHKTNYFVDFQVRYGGSYFYKIRTLCKVETLLVSESSSDPLLNQVVIGDVLMASEGKLSSITCIEKIPPPPPEGLRFTFDFKTLLPKILWQFPLNKQRDIKRFQVFKRMSVDEPFTVIAEIDFDNSAIRGSVSENIIPENYYRVKKSKLSFIDKSHKEGEKPIYAVACVDAHGMSSNYSTQVQVERDKYTNRVNRKIISGPNAPKPFPNIYLNEDTFRDVIKSSNFDRMNVFFDPEYYRVFKTKEGAEFASNAENLELLKDLELLAIDSEKPRYKIHIINIDNQKDKLITLKIKNYASPSATDQDFFETETAKYNPNNLSFQYGVNS